MKEITYSLQEHPKIQTLGWAQRTKEGRLLLVIDASTPEDAQRKVSDLGRFNNASIYLDGVQVNYQKLFGELMKD